MNDIQEKQDLLRISAARIRRQGGPSMHGDTCSYRGPDGRGCAAEPFITKYNPRMEGYGFSTLAAEFSGSVDPIAAKHNVLVDALQSAHDRPAFYSRVHKTDFMAEYEDRIAYTAEQFNLHVPRRVAMGRPTF